MELLCLQLRWETLFCDGHNFHVNSSKSVCAFSDNEAPNENGSCNNTTKERNILDKLGKMDDEILYQHIET